MREGKDKKDFLSIFPVEKPVLGMLHLKGDSAEAVVKKAFEEARTMIENGVDAVIVENYYGKAADVENVLRSFQSEKVDFIYGVNVLHDDEENFRMAREYGAAFLQIDSVAGHLTPEEDQAFGEFIDRCRAAYEGFVIGGVRFKYQPYLSGRTLEEDLRIGMERCDAIAVTGDGTGMLTPTEKLKEFRELAGDFPLVVAAGVVPDSCEEQFQYADAAIVGSYLKDTYKDTGDVDAAHVKEFMDAVGRCRPSKFALLDAVEITDLAPEELAEYGVLYNLSGSGADTGNVHHSSGDGWEDTDTAGSLLDTLGSLGYTKGSAVPFAAAEMERHLHTEEAQIPAGKPIVFCLAKASEHAPSVKEIKAVILRPGYVFVLHRGTWHSASHGMDDNTYYYWMALAYCNEPTVWERIPDGPLTVCAGIF